MKKILFSLICILLLLTGCTNLNSLNDDNIIILFTNDTHGAIDDNIGFASVAGYKKQMEKESKYVVLVDGGDETQGSYLTTLSKGGAGISVLNLIGYDYAVFGNHEYAYGNERLKEFVDMANYQFLNCNVSYSGSGSNPFENTLAYKIEKFGKFKVGFIGVTTPDTLAAQSPAAFKEGDKKVFDFCEGNNGETLINRVQETVDEVKKQGADYVVLISHLGNENTENIYTSKLVVENTKNIDAVIDAHSHYTVIEQFNNLDGEAITVAQTGTKLEHIGKLTIAKDGSINFELISNVNCVDNDTLDKILEVKKEYDVLIEDIIGNATKTISTKSEDGIRIVRSRETAIGNLCSDAIRDCYHSDISYINGGGIRADIKEGSVTYADVINVHSFGNMVVETTITGQELVDMIEYWTKDVQKEYKDKNNNAYGENGSYCCMSGVKFCIDLNKKSDINIDEETNLVSIGNSRRVSDVLVLQDGEYVPVDLTKTYTFAASAYTICEGGSGMAKFLKDHPVIADYNITDYEVLGNYIKNTLKGNLDKYNSIDNRVTYK